MLNELSEYLLQRGSVSLSDVANHFEVSEDFAKQMMDYLIEAGQATFLDLSCNTCGTGNCDVPQVVYQVIKPAAKVAFFNKFG